MIEWWDEVREYEDIVIDLTSEGDKRVLMIYLNASVILTKLVSLLDWWGSLEICIIKLHVYLSCT